MSQIPEERDIKKQELWKRMEEINAGIHTTVQNFQTQIDEMLDRVTDAVNRRLADERKELEQVRSDLRSEVISAKNALTKHANSLEVELKKNISQTETAIDARWREFEEGLKQHFTDRMDEILNTINGNIDGMVKKVDIYQAEVRKEVHKYMTELGGKYGQVKALVESVQEKLKKFATL